MPVITYETSPVGWETMFAADIGDAETLEDIGCIFSEKLSDIVLELFALGFRFNPKTGIITGQYQGKMCMVTVWFNGILLPDTTMWTAWGIKS